MSHASRPQLPSHRSNPSCCWRAQGVLAVSNALARGVLSTASLPRLHPKNIQTSNLAQTAALTASTIWEASLFPNWNQSHSNRLLEASSKRSLVAPRIYPHLRRTVPRISTRRISGSSLPSCSLSILVAQVIFLGVAVDGRSKLGQLGVWWTFRSLNVVGVHVDVRMDGVDVEFLVLDVVWKAMFL